MATETSYSPTAEIPRRSSLQPRLTAHSNEWVFWATGCDRILGSRFPRHGLDHALNEAGFQSDVIERQLAHQERNGVRASYNHATYMDERRVMMQVWADTVDDMRKETSSNQITFMRALTFQPA